MILSFKSSSSILAVSLACSLYVSGQATQLQKDEKTTEKAAPQKATPAKPVSAKDAAKSITAEQVIESAIVIYAFPGGRAVLDQIRKTAFERGRMTMMNSDGKMETANYQRWTLRGTTLNKERVRLDQTFPTQQYSLVQAEDKVVLIFNDTVFAPREDASKSFRNQIYRGLDGFLRYKENESKIELAGKEKHMGVEFYIIDVTDKQDRKTRYFVSAKSFRVMMLEYEDDGKKYKRKFYNYNYAQGTLVPYKTVLYQGDKIVEETEVGTVTFGQKVDEGLFAQGQS